MAGTGFRNSSFGVFANISGYRVTDTTSLNPALGYDPSRPVMVERVDHDGDCMEIIGEYADLFDAVAAIHAETSILRLNVSVCDQRRGYQVTFEGPDADAMAMEFFTRKSGEDKAAGYTYGNHAYHEVDGYPYDTEKFSQVFQFLNPACEHGLSANLCYGPAHYAREGEVAAGW